MRESSLTDNLLRAEGLLVEGLDEAAEELLIRLAEDAEEYVDRNCPTTDEVQWFSFPTAFEKLAYRRVEADPRELKDVGEPLDRLYADLALACVRLGDYEQASEALKQAVRWNPMECGYRLDLAELYRTNGNIEEYLALTHSVFERASDARHLVRAFLVFEEYFEVNNMPLPAAAALRAAQRFEIHDSRLDATLERVAGGACDPSGVSDAQTKELLADEGLPDAANVAVVLCLLQTATEAAEQGEQELATNLTIRARDLVGAEAADALIDALREAAADDAADTAASDTQANDSGAVS